MSERNHQENVSLLLEKIEEADAILVGAAAGMSASCGYNFFYKNDKYFQEYFGSFHEKYGYEGAFDGFYYRYRTSQERWAFIARLIYMLYEAKTGETYYYLLSLLQNKKYHILTTNQDFQFNGLFLEDKISAIQGDWRYFQCGRRCHDGLYYNKEMVYEMNEAIDEDLKIPKELIPHCPKCGSEMEPWVRGYSFLEGKKYKQEYEKCNAFIEEYMNKKMLFLELGVGKMTPMFIQEPFWNLTYRLPNAFYININPQDALLPKELKNKGAMIKEDIKAVFEDAVKMKG